MFKRRFFPTSVLLGLSLAMASLLSVASAQEVALTGSANFRDAGAASDSLVMNFAGMPQPPLSMRYEGWLISGDGTKLSVGFLNPDATGAVSSTYVSPDGTNLLDKYTAFAITVEPVPDQDPGPSSNVAYADSVPSRVYPRVSDLVLSFAANPGGKGIAAGMREQAAEALHHAGLAKRSATFEEQVAHLRQVVNIVQGVRGADYDATVTGAGDGVGVVNYAAEAIVRANMAKRGLGEEHASVAARADEVIASANNVVAFANSAVNNARSAFAQSESNIVVTLSIDNVIINLTNALRGIDADGDGVTGSVGSEGGAIRAYTAAQDLAEFIPIRGAVPVPVLPPRPPTPPETGDSLVSVLASGIFLAGLLFTATGILLLRRSRQGHRPT